MQPRFLASIAVSAIAAVLMTFNLIDRGHVDGLTIGSWRSLPLHGSGRSSRASQFPGGSIRFRQIRDAQQRQAQEIRTPQFLITHLLTRAEQEHLEKLATRARFQVVEDAPEAFFNEMHHLRALEFIRGLPDKGIRSMRVERGDVRNHFEITEVGREYLRLVKATSSSDAED